MKEINYKNIIKERIICFNELLKTMEQKKKTDKKIKDLRNKMWALDQHCSTEWRD